MAIVEMLALIFVFKVLENMFEGTKIILLQKNRYFFAGIMVFIAILINYNIMKIIVSSDGYSVMITAAAAASIGYMLAGKISAKLMHGTYLEIIRTDNEEAIHEIHDFLTDHNIKHDVLDTYNKSLTEKRKVIYASPKTEKQQRMINDFIKNSSNKFGHVIIE